MKFDHTCECDYELGVDLPNGLFGSATGHVFDRFGSLSGQLCLGSVRVQVKHVHAGFGFGSGEVRVLITYRYHARVECN